MPKNGTIKNHYWVEGSALFVAEAEYWKNGFFRKVETTELLKSFSSNEEAKKALKKLEQAERR